MREVDPFFQLAAFMEDVFACLKSGTITPEKAHKDFNAMLNAQRNIHSTTQQQKQLEQGDQN